MDFHLPKQKLLVSGGAGFIGSNFVQIAVDQGHDLIILDALTYAGHKENLEDVKGPGKYELIQGNINDFHLVSTLLKDHQIDSVINFAAESHVDRSIDGPALFIETNIQGTFNLLNACLGYWRSLPEAKKRAFRYLQISTDEVYGSLGPTGKFSETTPYAPNSPYSASKASGDHLVRAWHHTYGLPTLITNCSNNYGPKQFPEKLIPTMITQALAGKPLPVYGDGKNVRDWIHVTDHCRGVLLALERGQVGKSYCFGGNAERNNLDLVKTLCRELDSLSPRQDGKPHSSGIEFVADRPGHDLRYAIDDQLAQDELGFVRKFQFEEGLRNTIQWYLNHQKWCETVMGKNR